MPKTLTPEQKIIRYQRCAECGERLTEWLNPHTHERFIACSRNENHRITARKYEQPPQLVYELWREEMTNAIGPVRTNQIERYYGNTNLTKPQAIEIIKSIWPDAEKASPAEVYKAIMLCTQYGLNPLMKHLFLIPHWNSDKKCFDFVCVQGISSNRLIASRKHNWSFLDDTPRVGNEEEEKKHYRTIDPDKIRAIAKIRDIDCGKEVTAWGEWPRWKIDKQGKKIANEPKGIDKGNSMENMACIHAERKGIDMLYPADLPNLNVPVIDDNYESLPQIKVEVEGQQVDTATGEITEAPPTEQPEDLWEDAKKEPAPAPVTADEIKAVQDLAKSKGHTKETWDALIWQECALGNTKGMTRENLAKLQDVLNKQPNKV